VCVIKSVSFDREQDQFNRVTAVVIRAEKDAPVSGVMRRAECYFDPDEPSPSDPTKDAEASCVISRAHRQSFKDNMCCEMMTGEQHLFDADYFTDVDEFFQERMPWLIVMPLDREGRPWKWFAARGVRFLETWEPVVCDEVALGDENGTLQYMEQLRELRERRKRENEHRELTNAALQIVLQGGWGENVLENIFRPLFF
jgi:hypothetical protein